MLQSQLFTKTRREAPKDEVSKNADLLIRAGFINKEMAGVYSLLPLGLRVMEKIVGVIRKEMNAIGGQEVLLTALQNKETWETTNRWDEKVVDVWFKTELKNGGELGLSFTHEEPLTQLMKNFISSYRDLPRYVYQFQTKFRNETRAKSGIMRGREFLMKDLYSFSKDENEHNDFYEKAKIAYMRIFNELGIGDKTFITFASGGSFSKYSHEFQTLSDAGEDTIYVHEEKGIAVNEEVMNEEVLKDLGVEKSELKPKKAVEVGNIFSLGTKFSEPFGLNFLDEKGEKKPVIMGSYGIGPGRLMGIIAETLSDDKGLIWPKTVAPFDIHLIQIGTDKEVVDQAKKIESALTSSGLDVLWDDRDARPGEKFNDSELMGIPISIVVSKKTNESGAVEMKNRKTGHVDYVEIDNICNNINNSKNI